MESPTCDQVRETLWPDPAASTVPEALAHYDACPACRRFFALQARLGNRLAAVRRVDAPQFLRARVERQLDVFGSRPWRLRAGIAALAAALLLASLTLRPPGPAAPFAPAASYLAAMPIESVMVDRMEASAALSARLAMALVLPDLEGAEFMGADLVEVSGQMWAAARYRFRGRDVAYFAMPMDDAQPASDMRAGRKGRWQVAVWEESDGMRALAGEAPLTREDIMALASECRAKSAMEGSTRS